MYTKIIVLIATIAVASAQYGGYGGGDGGYGGHGGYGHEQVIKDYHAPAHYEFKYGVSDHHTGDEHQQSESRQGDTVKGEYSLREADGTIRVVKYTADPHNGFNAVVERKGHAAHPEVHHKVVAAAPVISYGHSNGGYGGHAQSYSSFGIGGGHGGGHGY